MQQDQALLVFIKLSNSLWGTKEEEEYLFSLEDILRGVIEVSGVGEYDFHEFNEGFFTIFIFGTNTDNIFQTIYPFIKKSFFPKNSFILKRYGGLGAKEEKISLPLTVN